MILLSDAVVFLVIFFTLFPTIIHSRSNNAQQNRRMTTTSDSLSLNPEEIAILQFDSRPLRDYWLTSALWNKHYCDRHGHLYLYYTTSTQSLGSCRYNNEPLASPWCKVKAMIQANRDYPQVRFFLYLDSDAVIDRQFADISLNTMINTMRSKLDWNYEQKPIIFNQDGPCWWCRLIKKVGYSMCLNAGKRRGDFVTPYDGFCLYCITT